MSAKEKAIGSCFGLAGFLLGVALFWSIATGFDGTALRVIWFRLGIPIAICCCCGCVSGLLEFLVGKKDEVDFSSKYPMTSNV
jgi:hypothetical protein